MHELRKTSYVPRALLLGSREKMCVNPDVRGGSNFQVKTKCKKLGANCSFKRETKNEYEMPHEAFDIEELHKLGS